MGSAEFGTAEFGLVLSIFHFEVPATLFPTEYSVIGTLLLGPQHLMPRIKYAGLLIPHSDFPIQ